MKKYFFTALIICCFSTIYAQNKYSNEFALKRFKEFLANDKAAFLSHYASEAEYKKCLRMWNEREEKNEFDTTISNKLRKQNIANMAKSFDSNYKNFRSLLATATIDSFQTKWVDHFVEENIISPSFYTESIFLTNKKRRFKFDIFCLVSFDWPNYFLVGGFLKVPVTIGKIDLYNRAGNILITELDLPIVTRGNRDFSASISLPEPPKVVSNKKKAVGNDETIYTAVEVVAEFSGGEEALNKFINKNLKYPRTAKESGIEGIVYVQFVVNKNGSIADPKVVRDICSGCGIEVLRLVKLMPPWRVAELYGNKVRSEVILPIEFSIPEEK